MQCGSIDSVLDADEEDEEPPRILLYHGKTSTELTFGCSRTLGRNWAVF